jgi:hypothetical protein
MLVIGCELHRNGVGQGILYPEMYSQQFSSPPGYEQATGPTARLLSVRARSLIQSRQKSTLFGQLTPTLPLLCVCEYVEGGVEGGAADLRSRVSYGDTAMHVWAAQESSDLIVTLDELTHSHFTSRYLATTIGGCL